MNQFRVECSEVTYFTVLVEADTEDEAMELAHADINSFPVEDEYVSESHCCIFFSNEGRQRCSISHRHDSY